jgi:hypothetical protein
MSRSPRDTLFEETVTVESTQTLHDFVLNLLTNPDARSAFELDPEGTLQNAGLSDLTPADVQDVVPLVVDYVPVQGITDLSALEGLGLGALDAAPTAVIGQLQTVTHQLTASVHFSSSDVNVAALGAISVDPSGLGVSASILPDAPRTLPAFGDAGLAPDLSGAHDVAGTLDSNVLAPADGLVGTADGVVAGTVGTADGLVGGPATDGVLGTTDFAVHTVTSTVGSVTGLVGVGDLGDTVNGVTGVVGGTVGSVTGLVGAGDLGDTVSGVTGAVGGTVGSVTGSLGLNGDTHGDVHTAHAAHGGLLGGLTDGLL